VKIILAKCDRCLWRGWWIKGQQRWIADPDVCPDCGGKMRVAEANAPPDGKFTSS
jgi:hypothetical protein